MTSGWYWKASFIEVCFEIDDERLMPSPILDRPITEWQCTSRNQTIESIDKDVSNFGNFSNFKEAVKSSERVLEWSWVE
jgi:hypothetical protein